MTETESRWFTRVAAWKASGQTAPKFCKDKDYTLEACGTGLRAPCVLDRATDPHYLAGKLTALSASTRPLLAS